MKRILAIALATLLIAPAVFADTYDVYLRWNANPPLEMVTKYVVHQRTLPATNYIAVVTATGTNAAKVRLPGPGSYSFKIVAWNGLTNAAPSDAANWPTNGPSMVTGNTIEKIITLP